MLSKRSILIFTFFSILFSFFPYKTVLADTFSLSGNVADSSGIAVSGAQINVITSSNVNVASSITDAAGNYSLDLSGGTYNVQAVPPAGSDFSSAISLNKTILSNTTINFIFAPADTIILSGHIYDPLGNPLPHQQIQANGNGISPFATTDNEGFYTINLTPGTYQLIISNGSTSNVGLNSPLTYVLFANNFPLDQSTDLDIRLPAKKLIVHIKDNLDTPVTDSAITTSESPVTVSNLDIGGGITNATGFSEYHSSQTKTNLSGDAELWLFQNDINSEYTLTVTPPNGSGYSQTIFTHLIISTDSSVSITISSAVTLSGHIYDPLGNPLPHQSIQILGSGVEVSVTTNSSGLYTLQAVPNIYRLIISNGATTNIGLNSPLTYAIIYNDFLLQENKSLDIILPAKKTTVHIKDSQQNPISDVVLTTPETPINVANLNIGGGITTATGYSEYHSSQTKTNALGDIVLWLFPNDMNSLYTLTATPNSESNFPQTQLSNLLISEDNNQVITLRQPIILSGHIYDPLGNPLPHQTIELNGNGTDIQVSTSEDGSYLIRSLPGSYSLTISNDSITNIGLNAPLKYAIFVNQLSITDNKILDINLPAKKVSIHVQNQAGQSLSDINLTTSESLVSVSNLDIGSGITHATGFSEYHSSQINTNGSGDVILWLFPNDSGSTYDLTANPQSGSIYSVFTLNNITVTADQDELISLQYSHNPLTTSLLLSPEPFSDQTYQNPVTISLSSSAAPTYSIANSYYIVDGLSQQTYTTPFEVSGVGEHNIVYWSVDNTGVIESHKEKVIMIHMPINQLTSLSDAKIWVGVKNNDDVGLKFDLLAQVYKDNVLISTGQLNSVIGGSSGFSNAKLNSIPFASFAPIVFPSGSHIKIQLYARNACIGSGKKSGTARLWFNDARANSHFGASIGASTNDFFMVDGYGLSTLNGIGPKKTIDIEAGAKCSSFKSFGTWDVSL